MQGLGKHKRRHLAAFVRLSVCWYETGIGLKIWRRARAPAVEEPASLQVERRRGVYDMFL